MQPNEFEVRINNNTRKMKYDKNKKNFITLISILMGLIKAM